MSADIIPFMPRDRRAQSFKEPTGVFRSKATPDDLVMDHADTPPCEYTPWRELTPGDDEPA